MQVVAAPDKFRATASAGAVADAIANGCWSTGADCTQVPLSDGGEGLIDVFGGPNRTSRVTGPLGDPVDAAWRLDGRTALLEMATASGLALVGGAEHNRALDASTVGTGELIMAAVRAGARDIVVGLGGSATTDGGLGAVDAIASPRRLAGVDLLIAHDVNTLFCDAAEVFAPQKGATPTEVKLLSRRLGALAERYRDEFGVDVADLPGSGAAGGLAGGLVALGGQLIGGFDYVSVEVELEQQIAAADLVITGEGRLDDQSFDGKVVGGVIEIASRTSTPVVALVGQADTSAVQIAADLGVTVVSLTDRFGLEEALHQPLRCIEQCTTDLLADRARNR